MADLDGRREEWKTLYSKTLPQLAKARDPAQRKWPVSLDHCFARIILDNTIGQGTQQWDQVIQKPAVRNMTESQLQDAIDLGTKIQKGEMDLQELDQISLMCRGKNEGKYGGAKRQTAGKGQTTPARKRLSETEDGPPAKRAKTGELKQQSTLAFKSSAKEAGKEVISSSANLAPSNKSKTLSVDYGATLKRIRSHPSLTPYRKRLYTTLLSVPEGRYTTYAAMSHHLNSSARAVGSGMRNNPFAPEVPCHRVLAADGSLGGFKGDWGVEGKYAKHKLELLRAEGVRFDGKGKVVGEPFKKFHEFEKS